MINDIDLGPQWVVEELKLFLERELKRFQK